MPGSPKIQNVTPYSKAQDGELSADNACRSIVKIGSVSAGIEIDANIVNTDPIDVALDGTVDVEVVNSAAIDVSVNGVANVNIGDDALLTATVTTVSTTSSGAAAVVAAQGATTAIRIHGFSIFNESNDMLQVELRYGDTPFWRGALASEGGGMNWNVVGRALQGANNAAINVYHAAAGKTSVTIFWEKV